MKKLLASSMGSNEKVNSNKLFCTLKISKDLIEYVQEKNKIFFVPVLTDAGYPIWWGIAAWPVDNFVKGNDFTGKTVIPFCTSSSSGLGDSGNLLEEMAGTGDWQEGHRFSSGASDADAADWVASLNLNE